MQKKIYILDVTNRDGVQTARLGLAKLEKTMINLYLDEMGVHQSEFGFPVTKHETNYINANLEMVKKRVFKNNIILSGWIRAIPADVKEALRLTKVRNLNVSISTSDQMIKGKFRGKMSGDGVIKAMVEAVKLARQKGIKILGVNAEDASRTHMDFLIKFGLAAKKAGADRIRYCDTLGYDDPLTIYERVKLLAEEIKLPIELHCHNDLGMGVATSVMGAKGAIDGGVDAYINTTVNGLGERAGNADLTSVILALRKSSGFGNRYTLDKKIDLSRAWNLANFGAYAFGVPLAINQPGVGANAFSHASGIHADGALKDRRNYELYDYEELGRGEPEFVETGRQIIAGEYSGIKGFRNIYERLEVPFKNDKEAAKILELVRYANVHTQKPLTNDELKFIAKYPEFARKIMTVKP